MIKEGPQRKQVILERKKELTLKTSFYSHGIEMKCLHFYGKQTQSKLAGHARKLIQHGWLRISNVFLE